MPTETSSAKASQLRTASTLGEDALRILRFLRDDVDHTIDRVRSPNTRAGAADDFNAIDVFKQHVLHIPKDARVQRRVHGTAVDQDQQLVGCRAVETSRADRPLTGIDLRD